MVEEKMIGFNFGGAASPRLQTLGAGAGKPWVPTRHVGLQATICRHMAFWLSWALGSDPHAWLKIPIERVWGCPER